MLHRRHDPLDESASHAPQRVIAAVTGANGFIGRNLTRRLVESGWCTRAIVRSKHAAAPDWIADLPSAGRSRLQWLPLEYDDRATLSWALRDADVIFHVAGATRAATVAALDAANVGVAERVVDAMRVAGGAPPRIVFVSSQAAAGPALSRDRPRTESDAPAPVEPYGAAKLRAESVVSGSGFPHAILRPAAVYGPGDHDFLNLFRLARHGIAIHPGNRDHWLSVVHVRDLVDGLLCAATDERALGGTFFLANDEPVRWRTLFGAAAAAVGAPLRIDVDLPGPLVSVGGVFGDLVAKLTGSAPLLTTRKLMLARQRWWICDSRKATEMLGFAPRVTLPAGLRETYHWYIDHRWL